MRINSIPGYTLLLFLLVGAQVLVFNNIQFGGYINPYVYVLFIMLLPVDIKGGPLLISAFFLGLVIDVFLDSIGMHAAATLCMAFARPFVIRLISVRADFEAGTIPTISGQGLRWIMTYTMLLIICHHFPLFFLEVFRFSEFWSTLYRMLLSSAFSFVFVLLGFFLIGQTSGARE